MKKQNIMKGASILLIATALILSAVGTGAKTDEYRETKIPNLITKSALLEEGFEGTGLPSGWIDVNYDGDSYSWDCDWTYSPHSGSQSAASASYVNYVGPLTPDNWLITPAIDLTGVSNVELTFWTAAQDPNWAADHIEVRVSTTGTTVPTDFADEVYDYTEVDDTWKEHSVDLSDYADEIIYLAFRHCECTDWYWIKIDDVTVAEAPSIPDLDCSGELDFVDVEPNGTVSGTITVENIGEADSELNWEIESFPDWGTWTFDPDSGTGLAVGDTVEITVDIVAPDEPEETFTGEVVLVNSDDPDDTCTIQVSLVTPVSHQVTFLELLAQRFPILAKILALIF